jgi:hypothetical protein
VERIHAAIAAQKLPAAVTIPAKVVIFEPFVITKIG